MILSSSLLYLILVAPPQDPPVPEAAAAEEVSVAAAEQGEDAAVLQERGESRLIALDELDQVEATEQVTVLYHCKNAEATSVSGSVLRSFSDQRALRAHPDARANAVFVTGPAVLVREAVRRMEALEELTPPKPERPVRRPPQDPAAGPMSVAEDYEDGVVSASSRLGFLIAGLIGLAVAGLLVARRLLR